MSNGNHRIETKLIHSGRPSPLIGGAVSMPVFQSSTFRYMGTKSYDDLRYIRLNNTPNHEVLHQRLSALENAEDALVTGSGMAAISAALLSTLNAGDHLLAQSCLYGGTHDLITRELPGLGISFDFIDADDASSWKSKLRPNTKAIYVESMTNPLLEVGDLKAVADFAKSNRLVSLIDNTFASPLYFRPAEHGYDLSLHSATKYLNGHTDIVAGAIIGRAELVKAATKKLNLLGGSLDPHACFLLERGMKTLAVRLNAQSGNALRIAKFLEQHPKIARVNYPGLTSHPRHTRAAELFNGFGGMLSFELKEGVDAAEEFISRLQMPVCAPSLGGVETLITRPATTSHSGMSAADRLKLGITDSLIRLSVGIEAAEDLLADISQALG
jgi:cystathionine beta-lyase/cystathionine gamma-synthase